MSGTTVTTTTHIWRPSTARSIAIDGFLPVPRGTLPVTPAPLSWPAKDPGDVLDYEFDIAAALLGSEGDTIASVDATVSPGATGDLVVNSVAVDGTVALFWFAGGQAGTVYTVHVSIVTVGGRTISRALLLPVLSLTQAVPATTSLTTDQGTIITDQNGNPILLGS